MTIMATPNADAAAKFIGTAPGRNYQVDVVEAARMALVDAIGVALGAHSEGAGRSVRNVAANWGASGNAQILLGGQAASASQRFSAAQRASRARRSCLASALP